jgi:hypothetical protein
MGVSMRKVVILTGLLFAAALLPGAPAKAVMGCECVKLGAHAVCTATVGECTHKIGGLCLLPCSYTPAKMSKRHVRVKEKKMVQKPAHPKDAKDDKKKM